MKSHMISCSEEHSALLLNAYKTLKEDNSELREDNSELREDISELQAHLRGRSSESCIFKWRITNWTQKLRQAKQVRNRRRLFSSPFYTGDPGYKLRLIMYPNGSDTGGNTHMSLKLQILAGKHDGMVSWPFLCPFTFKLVEQKQGGEEISDTLRPAELHQFDLDDFLTKPSDERRNDAIGFKKFARHSIIDSAASSFVRNDCLIVKAEVDCSSRVVESDSSSGSRVVESDSSSGTSSSEDD